MTHINSLSDTVSQLRKGSRDVQARIQALATQARQLLERFGHSNPPDTTEAQQPQPQLTEALDEVSRLRAEHTDLTQELSERDSALERVREQMTELRAERSVLQAEVTGLTTTLAAEHTDDGVESSNSRLALQDERQVLAIKVEVLSDQLKELERLREESALRKASDVSSAELRHQLKDLADENAHLRSLGLVREHPPLKPLVGGKAQIGSLLDGLLGRLAQRDTARGAVVADLSGLVVAADVEDAESFAAVTAMLHQTGERAANPLPLVSAQRVMIADENELTVTVIPLRTDTAELLLATLTAGPGPTATEVSSLLDAASSDG